MSDVDVLPSSAFDPSISHDSITDANDQAESTVRVWPWTRLVLRLIHGYQAMMEGRPSPCRFTPSCSTYAMESLRTHGLLNGSRLAVWRILRCNPWGGQGFDPVPPRRGRRSGDSSPSCNHQQHNHHKAN